MKNLRIAILFILAMIQLIFLCSGLFAQSQSPGIEESIRPTKAKVLEEFTYIITHDENLELILPQKGDLIPDGMDLPIAEILSLETKQIGSSAVTKNQLQTTILIRFFTSGTYLSPVKWKLPDSDEEFESHRTFVVEPNMGTEENEEAEIRPPWEFGDFLYYRLFIIILIVVLLLAIAYIAYKKYRDRVLDAIIEAPFEPPPEEWVEKKFRDLFANQRVSQKEFAYLLTEYLKLQASKKFNSNFDSLTDQDLLYKIYQSSTITKEKVDDAKYFFLYSKYKPNFEDLDWKEAKEILDEWKGRLS
ncbi:MAG: hypothetical protein JJT78_00440 [Leptospira sp.]|nr:hypothetical protein [Leptospira sp.]